MLDSIEIWDYQSHRSTKLALGRFTVLTGRTGSGKSSVVRALSLLAANTKGTGYIRSGSTKTTVVATVTAGDGEPPTRVSCIRAPKTSEYRVRTGDGESERYTKCGTGVPDDVTSALGLPSDPSQFVAAQFDRPYLLTDTASTVARTLGEVTGADMVHAATREAGRRKTGLTRDLTAKTGELERIRDRVRFHRDLPTRRASCQAAGEALARAEECEVRARRLGEMLIEARSASTRFDQLQPAADTEIPEPSTARSMVDSATRLSELVSTVRDAQARAGAAEAGCSADIPGTGVASETVARAGTLTSLLDVGRGQDVKAVDAESRAHQASMELDDASAAFTRALARSGQCPTCGQQVSSV